MALDWLQLSKNARPYPFSFDKSYNPPDQMTPLPHILLIGDRMGESLTGGTLDLLKKELSKNISTPLIITSWAQKGEGLHRSLYRLMQLKKLPPIIVYYGGSEETNEEIFPPAEVESVISNFERYNNPYFKTLLGWFPSLSRILYRPTQTVVLKEKIIPDQKERGEEARLKQLETHYHLYEILIEQLILTVQKQQKALIFITPPLNLEVLPKKVVSYSSSEKILKTQNYIYTDLITPSKFKEAQDLLEQLNKASPDNALTEYMLGHVLLKQERLQEGLTHLEIASTLDLDSYRGNIIYNNIIKNYASRYDIPVIDYHELINRQIGSNALFLNDVFPHQLFDQEMIKILAALIRSKLQI